MLKGKKITALIFAGIMSLMLAFSMADSDISLPLQGNCGDALTWVLDENGWLTISGEGPMWDRDGGYSTQFWNKADVKKVTIESGVTSIGYRAFMQCENLEMVSIPDSIVAMGESCFAQCESLMSVALPSTLLSIPKYAFLNCKKLADVRIANGTQTINEYAFNYCTNLQGICIPESVTEIKPYAFAEIGSSFQIIFHGRNTTIEGQSFNRWFKAYCYRNSNTAASVSSFYHSQYFNPTIAYLDDEGVDPYTDRTISLTCSNPWITCNQSMLVTPAVFPNDDNPELHWSVDHEDIATVDNGTVTAAAPGDAVVTAAYGTKSASITVHIYREATDFELVDSEVWISTSTWTNIVESLSPADANAEKSITWENGNINVANASGLRAIGYIPGNTTVTGRLSNGIERTCIIHVLGPISSVSFDIPPESLRAGETCQLSATVTDTSGNSCVNHLVNFASTDENVAMVDQHGVVTAVAPGTAEISAAAGNGKTDSVTITVTEATEPASTASLSGDAYTKYQTGLPSEVPSGGGFYNRGPLFWLDGYAEGYGDPVWSVTPINGGPAFRIEATNEWCPNVAQFRPAPGLEYTAGPGIYDYTVTCVWNGNTYTAETQIEFINETIPTGYSLSVAPIDMSTQPVTIGDAVSYTNGEIYMQSGTTYVISEEISGRNEIFDNYSRNEAGWSETEWEEIWPNQDERFMNTNGDCIIETSHKQVFIAKEPGTYKHDFVVQFWGTNLACYIPYTLKQTDADGVLPDSPLADKSIYHDPDIADIAPTLAGEEEINCYIGMSGNGILAQGGEVWQNSMIIDVCVQNAQYFSENYPNAEPEWTVRQTSGQIMDIDTWTQAWSPAVRYFRGELTSIPAKEGDSVFEVKCTWAGRTTAKTITVHCTDIDWPTGLTGIPDTVHTYVGAKLSFNPQIEPDGWQVPGYPQLRYGFDDEADEFAVLAPAKKDESNDPYIDINDRKDLRITASGTYESTYVITSDRVSVGKLVRFVIDDEPDWAFTLPSGIKAIESNAFEGISAESIYIPDGCTCIGEEAFKNSKTAAIYIPDSVEEIGDNALPEDVFIFTPEGSHAALWAADHNYKEYQIVVRND